MSREHFPLLVPPTDLRIVSQIRIVVFAATLCYEQRILVMITSCAWHTSLLFTHTHPRFCKGMRLSPCTTSKSDRKDEIVDQIMLPAATDRDFRDAKPWIGLSWRQACRRGPKEFASLRSFDMLSGEF